MTLSGSIAKAIERRDQLFDGRCKLAAALRDHAQLVDT
eukprot:CAMPEP_0183367334 /NCGR_PEP_ID=MMETSP0164_2-20130417/92105_1 /TAXON_ID=221442 /ORGANISM="Coccolithus pelagicus ssp braarudi, Strain PLY182g" /LENGTH=37 /DNA_ID= /DNA_START= /DNA_END= /DNA_ORIENTATION=